MPRWVENIYKRKDGRWEGRFIKGYKVSSQAEYGYIYDRSYKVLKDRLAEKKAGTLSLAICKTISSNI